MAGWLIAHAGWVAAGLLLVALLVLALMLLALQRSLREARRLAQQQPLLEPGAVDGALVNGGSAQPTMLAFRTSLKRLADQAGVRSPYTLPWVLLLGDRGAGKTTLARAAAMPRLLPESDTPAGEDATLHCYENGILIDAAGRAALSPDGRPAVNDQWRRLMRALQWYRPQRGLDGVILAISATDLMGAQALGTEMLAIKGDAFQAQLWDLQRRVGLRLPIYVVVTQCDHIPGFAAFWQAAPAGGTGTMLGWATPRATDHMFDAADVDQAIADVSAALWNHYVDAAAGLDNPADPDGMFRFPGEFPVLAAPLKTFLSRALRAAAFQETHFLRGIWFTGASEPLEAGDLLAVPAAGTSPLSTALTALRPGTPGLVTTAGSHAAIASAAPRLLFVTDLLAEKVFAEKGLAQPARTGLVARTRTSLIAQSALVGTTLVLAVGLFIADQWLQRTVAEVEPPLALIRQELAQQAHGGDNAFRSEAAHRLLTDFEAIGRSWLIFPFIPSSWDGRTDAAVSRSFGQGLDHLVLKALRAELERRYTLLRDVPPIASLSENNNHHLSGAPDVEAMAAYLRKVEGLDRLAAEYAAANKGSVEKLANLSNSLFGTRLDGNFAHNAGLYLRGLHQVHIPPLSPDHARQVKSTLGVMAESLTRRIGSEGDIVERVRRLADAVADVKQPRKGQDIGQRMQDLAASLVDVRRMLDDPGLLWLASDDITTSPAITDLMAMMATDSVGAEVRNQFAAGIRDAHKALVRQLLEFSDGDGERILVRSGSGAGFRLNDHLHALSDHFQPALNRPFMREHPRVSLSMPPAAGSGQVMSWDPLALAEVLKTYRSYEEFRAVDLPRIPADFQSAVDRMGRQRLEDSLRNHLVAAQKIDRSSERFQDFGESALTAEVTDLRQVSEQLIAILSVLSQNRLDDLHDELRRVMRAHAGGLLTELDELTTMESFYEPVDGFANWDGHGSAAEAGFYAADDVAMAQYLDNMRGRLEHLWNNLAAPLVDMISRNELGSGWQDGATLFYWQSIGQGLQRYAAKAPGNSLTNLESLLRVDLPRLRLDECEEKLAGSSGGPGDFFQQRAAAIRAALLDRCRTLQGQSVNTDYAGLAETFNRTLAGHYPFVTGSERLDDDLPEADPDDVVRFLRDYAANGERLRKAMANRAQRDRQLAPVVEFLAQMDQVQAFLAPLVPTLEGAGTYKVAAEFRVNRPREVEANQIIEWALRIGVQELQTGDEAGSIGWRPGDPVSLRLRWARDGSVLPQPAGDQPYVDGLTATFAYEGRWALLRLLQSHRASFQDFGQGGDRQPHTLRFDVPTAPMVVRDLPGGPRPGQPTGEARIFVRVALSSDAPAAEPGKPAVRRRHVLPTFPAKAPTPAGIQGGDM